MKLKSIKTKKVNKADVRTINLNKKKKNVVLKKNQTILLEKKKVI